MIYERLVLMRDLLTEDGSIYVHCDWRVSGYLRLVMDEMFGKENFLNEVIWKYSGGRVEKKPLGGNTIQYSGTQKKKGCTPLTMVTYDKSIQKLH